MPSCRIDKASAPKKGGRRPEEVIVALWQEWVAWRTKGSPSLAEERRTKGSPSRAGERRTKGSPSRTGERRTRKQLGRVRVRAGGKQGCPGGWLREAGGT